MANFALHSKLIWVRQFFSFFGLLIAIFAFPAFLMGAFQASREFLGQHQTTLPINLIYLAFGSIFGVFANSRGLKLFIFLLPLTPNLHFQLQEYFRFNHFSHIQSNPGLDLIAGFILGVLANAFLGARILSQSSSSNSDKKVFVMPWQIGLAIVYIFFSSCLAVIRNIRQSASHTSIDGVIFNAMNFRDLSWHDDFMPLADLFAYALAALVIAVLLPILGRKKNPVYEIFHPLTYGIIVAAIWGILQSITSIGLPNELLNFRNDRLGFVAIGFQPDLHSYASHMLLGAVGLWGYYINAHSSSEKRLVIIAIILAWCALLLSKSRASLALAILVTIAGLIIYAYYCRQKNIKKILLILGSIGVVSLIIFWSLFNYYGVTLGLGWLELLIEKFSRMGVDGISAATQNFGGRPEIYLAGLRMWSKFPLIGLGQGEFFRQSAEVNFSQSFMLSRWGGENAHNYFLQILVENGLIGLLLFSYVVVFPIQSIFRSSANRMQLYAALTALGALFLGNIFAHSLLVRENLVLASIFLAFLYSCYYSGVSSNHNLLKSGAQSTTTLLLSVFAIAVIVPSLLLEVYRSFYRFPFQTGVRCFIAKPLTADNWTSGIYEYMVPAGAKGVRINFDNSNRLDIPKYPVRVRADVVYFNKDWSYDNNSLSTQQATWHSRGFESLDLKIMDNHLLENNRGKLVVRFSSCYVPKNLGKNLDGRSLGAQLINIEIY